VIDEWSAVLGTAVESTDDFFQLGGDSLRAARAAVALTRSTGRAVPLAAVLTHRRADRLAAWIDEHAADDLVVRPAAERGACHPVSYQQERRLLREVRQQDQRWRINFGFHLTGELDVRRLRSAIDTVVERHESLRSRFFVDDAGQPMQQVATVRPALRCAVMPGRGKSNEGEREALLEFFAAPFDRSAGEVCHMLLIQYSDVSWTLAFSFDHLVFDGGSKEVFLHELSTLFNSPDAVSELPAIPSQNRHRAWQQQMLASVEGERTRRFWRENLDDAFMPTEYFATSHRPGVDDVSVVRRLDPCLGAQLGELCRDRGVTPYVVSLAGLALVLDVVAARRDHVVQSPIARRDHPEFEQMIGWLAQVVAVRLRWTAGMSLDEFVGQTMSAVAASITHAALPWSQVIREFAPAEFLDPRPRATVFVDVVDTSATQPLQLAGVDVAPLWMDALDRPAVYRDCLGITLVVRHAGENWQVLMTASGRTFDQRSAEQFLRCYVRSLEQLARYPKRSVDEARDELAGLRSDTHTFLTAGPHS
jgi:hypothetical protein